MTSVALYADKHEAMALAVEALRAATNALTLGADTSMGIEKIGSGNWAYWCIHDN